MKVPVLLTAAAVLVLNVVPSAAEAQHLNPVIDLLAAKKQVFGLYAPSNPRGGRGGGRGGPPGAAGAPVTPPPVDTTPRKTPADLAKVAVTNTTSDFIFSGDMEGPGTFDQAYTTFADFAKGMAMAEPATKTKRAHPLFVKTPEIAVDPTLANTRISRQLNTGVMGIVMVGVESAAEVKQGLAAMRFKSKGGTRPDDVGDAPAAWGMSEKEYKEKADVWPLNPKGELVNMVIVESKVGLAHLDEIAAVPGISILVPGAGTLGGVMVKVSADGKDSLDANGRKVRDPVAWEGAIQQILAACKKNKLPCGYPSSEANVEQRIKEGFNVHIINWGDAGFKVVDMGRKAGGR
ncbi:MAG: aldolase/citrate lyase family protein [Gemmatimonas sp.]